ncbi:MAG: protein kinase [Planctomycetes bacterium]|nr:protein kinase [Planctomycetota bacterium]
MILLACGHCGAKLKVKDELSGRAVRCRKCQHTFTVPYPVEEATVPPQLGGAHMANEATTLSSSQDESILHEARLTETVIEDRQDPEMPDDIFVAGTRYQGEGEIARGGMGAIVRAVDQDIRREVAVKFILNQADERQKTRFIEEAQITGQLEHPNIVPIHQLGVHQDGRCFFSMKMVKGRSLADLLKKQGEPGASATGGGFSLGRLLNIFTNICNALAYAHARNVIHRDLKPANIMIGDFGEVYVMDWGLAKVLGQKSDVDTPFSPGSKNRAARVAAVATNRAADSNLTQAGAIMGTPAYMPPEQALGEAVDQRSDIYSLGAILYEILTLSPPVGRDVDQIAILLRVAEGAIRPPEKQAPERARQGLIPPELSAIALKALAKDPADRYQTVEALQRDIQLFVEGRSVSAKRDTAWELFKKLVKRNKGVSLATAAGLLVLAVVLGLAFYFINQERQEAVAARDKAEDNYQAFLKEQEEKRAANKKSAPAFLRAARLLSGEKQFEDALAQVNLALDYDREQTGAYLLKGQLLLGLERYTQALGPLEAYRKRKQDDPLAVKLVELAARPEPDKGDYLWALYDVFQKQKATPFADRMTHLVEALRGPQIKLQPLYQKRIEAAWPGHGNRLSLDKNGNLKLDLSSTQIRDLSPIKEMKLAILDLRGAPVEDLTPLADMPLTWLNLYGCLALKSLRGLEGMKLTWLNVERDILLSDLQPLSAMPLKWLNLSGCGQVKDLEPLRDTPLENLYMAATGVASLEPLRGMKLKKLTLQNCGYVKDLSPLRGMPLESLHLACYGSPIRDFKPLRGMPLQFLDMGFSAIHDLEVLRGMPLKELHMGACGNVRDLSPLRGMLLTKLTAGPKVKDLEPLRGMPLTDLSLRECSDIKDFGILKDMHLTWLSLAKCTQVRDLEFMRGKKLTHLNIGECTQLEDLTALAGMDLRYISLTPRHVKKGMEILRGMKSLDFIAVERVGQWNPPEFWKLYEKGEFKN